MVITMLQQLKALNFDFPVYPHHRVRSIRMAVQAEIRGMDFVEKNL